MGSAIHFLLGGSIDWIEHGKSGVTRMPLTSSAHSSQWLFASITAFGWILVILRDPLLPMFLLPFLYPFAQVSWWRIALAWVCNPLGEIALLCACTLLVSPRCWACVGFLRMGPPPQLLIKLLGVTPCPFRAVYAFITELSFLPALAFLLPFERALVDMGKSTWHRPVARLESQTAVQVERTQPKVILVHGAGINDCQWAASRHTLHMQGVMHVYSVNYFGGFWHMDAEGNGVPEFAAKAANEIEALGLEEGSDIILVGHSLGGIVSAYMYERGLLPGHNVLSIISVSSPFVGSALLGWAYRRLPSALIRRMRKQEDQAMDQWLVPDSTGLLELRTRMANNLGIYRFITGQLDTMVRPTSALCQGVLDVPTRQQMVLPHLHHYNIAGSAWAWAQVSHWIWECTQDNAR